jgi:translocation and assembly module TamB
MALPFKHFPQRTARLLGMVLVLLVVAFFATTRTELGRDAVARQLEAQFARSTRAQLQIGRLTGNLVQSFTATDVRVRSSDGQTILAVDTVFVRPSWNDILRRRLDTRRVELRGPRLHLANDSSGSSSWSELLSGAGLTRPEASAWSFQSARIVITDGRITAPRPGDPASQVTLGSNLRLDARVERLDEAYLVNVLSASGAGDEAQLDLVSASGQALWDSSSVVVNQFRLNTTGSQIDLAGNWFEGDPASFSLDLRSSRVSFDEISRIRADFPLRGSGQVRAAISGRVDDFVVSELSMRAGSSLLSLDGTVIGWPDSARVDLTAAASPLLRRDLDRLVPDFPMPQRLVVDSLASTILVSGNLLGERAGAAVSITAGSGGGQVTFAGELAQLPAGLRVVGDLETHDLDLGRIYLNSVGQTRLNTIATLDLTRLTASEGGGFSGSLSGAVRNSRLGAARFDLVHLRGDLTGLSGRVDAEIDQAAGSSTASLSWESHGIRWEALANGLDLGPLVGRDSLSTAIFGRLDGALDDGTSLFGSLAVVVDSAQVSTARGRSRVGPQTYFLDLAQEDSLVALTIRGTELAGRAVTDASPNVALLAMRFWTRALRDAVDRELNKPLRRNATVTGTAGIEASIMRNELLEALSLAPGSGQGSGVAGQARGVSLLADVKAADLARLRNWIPGGSPLEGGAKATLSMTADAETVEYEASLTSDSLAIGSNRLHGLLAGVSMSTRFRGPVEDALDLRASATADSVQSKISSLPFPDLKLTLLRRSGTLTVRSNRGSRVGPLALDARLQLLDDRNRLILDTLSLAARQLAWSLDQPAVLDIFSDAVTVENLAISEEVASQRLFLDGTISSQSSDTLSIVARSLRLAEVTEFSGIRRQLGGLLSADVQVTGGLSRPRMDGSIRVPAFVLDDRLLGNVRLDLGLAPGRDEVSVDLNLSPSPLPALLERVSEVIDNRVTLRGEVRLPSETDGGAWDMDLAVERADLFFLKYIFNTSVDKFTGHLVGGGRVSGPFGSPVVEASLEGFDGEFGIPKTGVRYTVDGAVRIDREAIHFDRATLRDQDGGRADLRGTMQFNDYRFFSFDVTGDLNDLLIMNRAETEDLPFYGFIRGTGSAALTGPLANATLRIPNGQARSDSELFIPITDTIEEGDASFIIFADSTGRRPDIQRLIRRPFVLARRASAERQFLAGLDMDLNIEAPRGSLIHLVIDPLLGDVINAQSTGRVQIRRNQGEFEVFGQMEVLGGDYLFTAGEVFVRRFTIQPGGTLSWVGDPTNARLNISAAYRTRASTTGLDDVNLGGALIPLVVELQITGLVASPSVELGLTIDRSNQSLGDYQALEARLNQPDRATEYATSVLLTNSFQLTTDNLSAGAGEQLAFNSVSQLVSSQLSRFLDAALPNVDFNFGLQGERAEDLDITYGVALRLLDERLIIRGEGVYQGSSTDNTRANTQGLQGEFVVEVKLGPSVSAQVFFRREGDILQNADLTNTAGAGLTYQTDFPSWRQALRRLFGREEEAVIQPPPPGDDGP